MIMQRFQPYIFTISRVDIIFKKNTHFGAIKILFSDLNESRIKLKLYLIKYLNQEFLLVDFP